jgi:hypothetical protein
MGAMTMASIAGGLAFLIIGLIEVAILQSVLYPALRWRHEQAKLTQSHGIEPRRIMALIRFQSLVVLPIIGFFAGESLKGIFG